MMLTFFFLIHKTVFRVPYIGLRTWPGIVFPTVIYSWVRNQQGVMLKNRLYERAGDQLYSRTKEPILGAHLPLRLVKKEGSHPLPSCPVISDTLKSALFV